MKCAIEITYADNTKSDFLIFSSQKDAEAYVRRQVLFHGKQCVSYEVFKVTGPRQFDGHRIVKVKDIISPVNHSKFPFLN